MSRQVQSFPNDSEPIDDNDADDAGGDDGLQPMDGEEKEQSLQEDGGREIYQEQVLMQDTPLHRNHSLSRSVYVAAEDDPDERQYEDSDFGVRVPLSEPAAEAGLDGQPRHGDHDDLDPHHDEHADHHEHKPHGNRAPFIQSPWEGLPSKATPIAPDGFVRQPKKAKEDQKTIFELPKSKELSAEVLELCSKLNTYDQLVSLLLIHDSFEPFRVDINYSDPIGGDTPLMRACVAGLLDIVQLLYECSFNWVIDYPLDVDKTDFNGATALMKAAQHGHLIIVKYLLEVLTCRVDLADCDGWTALMFAASKGHWHIVEYLVQARDADVLECTVQRDTPLMLAANNGYLNVVRYLVEQTDAGDKFDAESLRAKTAHLNLGGQDSEPEPEEEEERQSEDENGSENERSNNDDPDRSPRDEYDEDGNLIPKRKRRASKKGLSQEELEEKMKAERILAQHAANGMEKRGLEQVNLKGWTALIGAAHYGQLYVVHYLVSKGANPDLVDNEGYSARDIPMSLLAHNRFGVPVIQPQILAAIEAGMADRGKEKKNVKRNAVEKALLRFKRAERYMIDGDRARSCGQFEIAHLLYQYAFLETRPIKLVREEIELRSKAKLSSEQMGFSQHQLLQYRTKSVEGMLQGEAQRNFFLAERYIEDKAYSVALTCLDVSLQYEPTNEKYLETKAKVEKLQKDKTAAADQKLASAAARLSVADASSPTTAQSTTDEESQAEGEEGSTNGTSSGLGKKKKKSKGGGGGGENDEAANEEPKAVPRSCSLFGFSFF